MSTQKSSDTRKAGTSPLKKRTRLLSGYSILTRGEPFIWLTGGMLVVCVAMMIALLTLIISRGTSTFWPAELQLVPMRDGSLTMGEVSGRSNYILSSQQIDLLPTKAAEKAKSLLGENDSIELGRTYLRTGNFDLTGRHYSYISTVEAEMANAIEPQNGWVVERSSNGRFYGFPLVWSERFSVLGNEDFALLEKADSIDPNIITPELAKLLQDRLGQIRIEALRTAAQKWIDNRLEIQSVWFTADGKPARVTNRVGTMDATQLSSLVAYSSGNQNVESCYLRELPNIRDHLRQRETVSEEISAIDRRLESYRLAVRNKELSLDVDLPETLSSLTSPVMGIIEENTTLQTQIAALGKLIDDSNDDSLKELLSTAVEALKVAVTEINGKVDKSKSDLLEHLDKYPERLKDAVLRYINIREELLPEQRALSAELTILDGRLSLSEIEFAHVQLGASIDHDLIASYDFKKIGTGQQIELVKSGESTVSWNVTNVEPLGSDFRLIELDRVADELPPSSQIILQADVDDGSANQLKSTRFAASKIVRYYQTADLSFSDKVMIYGARWWEFLSDNPREANTEGGFFPAIWGTIVMTLIMTIVVVPFGVMAALYLREYTNSGPLVSIIRICINNLAGVPSIVYGVFGLAFFCYVVGGYVDGGPQNAGVTPWPPATWFVAAAVVAFLALACFSIWVTCSGPNNKLSTTQQRLKRVSMFCWVACLVGFLILLAKTPYFDGFYQASLPNPTFGKGGLLWASLTLALLTLPVVIVATEEALSAVPNSLREGSYACGASKWQTIQRIVLPHARPGILTGSILAMARGAGEVAPLMLVGALPSAIDLPLDLEFPFFHGSRSFMHLGFQIFALGFQSQNSEAAKPMVYTSTLLLIMIVAFLNVAAIWIRSRLKKRFQGNQF